MAHQEACQVYIEQEIKEGLAQGKTPYSIGKDLSAWVEKLFETSIPASTLERRARRDQEKLRTNVRTPINTCNHSQNHEKPQNQQVTPKSPIAGPGRLPKYAPEPKAPKPYSCARQMADIAISQLSRIPYGDHKRKEEGQKVIDWINDNLLNDEKWRKKCRKQYGIDM